jgi:hypothetical protein
LVTAEVANIAAVTSSPLAIQVHGTFQISAKITGHNAAERQEHSYACMPQIYPVCWMDGMIVIPAVVCRCVSIAAPHDLLQNHAPTKIIVSQRKCSKVEMGSRQ